MVYNKLRKIIKKAASPFKRLKLYIKGQMGWLGDPKIIAYKGYANSVRAYFSGMVLEDNGLSKPKQGQGVWKNMLAMLKRYAGDELAGVKVEAKYMGQTKVTKTNKNGIFHFSFQIQDEQPEKKISYHLAEEFGVPAKSIEGTVQVIDGAHDYIVVSDIDDTVLISHSTKVLKKLKLMLFKNAFTRLPFQGVSAFYNALKRGGSGLGNNPFFFVSSSEWNLYDLLEDFFNFRNIPDGVLLLKEMEHNLFNFWKSGGGNHNHKKDKIEHLLSFYPNYRFILMGDSGQRDPEIYHELALKFPNRIEAIYIRNVGLNLKKRQFKKMIDELNNINVDIVLVRNTFEAAAHALAKNLIHKNDLFKINKERQQGQF